MLLSKQELQKSSINFLDFFMIWYILDLFSSYMNIAQYVSLAEYLTGLKAIVVGHSGKFIQDHYFFLLFCLLVSIF